MVIEGSREYKAAQELERALNDYSWNPKRFDRNTPRLDLTGIRRRDDIVTLVRERVEYNKRKKGIYEITNH